MKNTQANIICPCFEIYCSQCQSEGHMPISCKDLVTWNNMFINNSVEQLSDEYIIANTKPCPKCSRIIFKDGGCKCARALWFSLFSKKKKMRAVTSFCAYGLCGGAYPENRGKHGETGGNKERQRKSPLHFYNGTFFFRFAQACTCTGAPANMRTAGTAERSGKATIPKIPRIILVLTRKTNFIRRNSSKNLLISRKRPLTILSIRNLFWIIRSISSRAKSCRQRRKLSSPILK